MALVSPGVEVTIIDQSQYLPAAPASVPLIVLATAENKANAAGTGIAVATTAANANKLYRVTSQRDLVTLYGNPFFYKTTNGTSLQGYELNEYGLLAAYSVLGTTNLCYVLRADIDLASLVGRTGRPSGAPADGTYWLNASQTTWGIFEFNQSTGLFTNKIPLFINDTDDMIDTTTGQPKSSIGNIGDYAVSFVTDTFNLTVAAQPNTYDTYWYKIGNNPLDPLYNTWIELGSMYWRKNWATIQGVTSNPTVVTGDIFILEGEYVVCSGTTAADVAGDINALNLPFVTADVVNDKLEIYSSIESPVTIADYEVEIATIARDGSNVVTVDTVDPHGLSNGMSVDIAGVTGGATSFNGTFTPITVTSTTQFTYAQTGAAESGTTTASSVVTLSGTPLADLGITPGQYYAPGLFYGTNAQQPSWRSTDAQPRPTGSVWIKTNAANGGTNLVMSRYSEGTATFISESCPLSTNDWTITASLDSAGGKNIAIGTLYAQYAGGAQPSNSPIQLYRRAATGAAVFVGDETAPSFATTSFDVYVSEPGTATLSSAYTVSLTSGDDATDFVTAWTAANIPYTTASVSTTGAIVLTHTEGGVIILDDGGVANSAVTEAGFLIGTTVGDCTPGAKWGPYKTVADTGVTQTATTGSGTGAIFTVTSTGFNVDSINVTNGGTGGTYAVGDVLTLSNGIEVKVLAVTGSDITTGLGNVEWIDGITTPSYSVLLSNWYPLSYVPNLVAPTVYPVNGTNWYYSVINQVDIMTNYGGNWRGYKNVSYASNGLPQSTGSFDTDPAGPILSATVPTSQSDGTALVYGDLWIDTNDLENYPVISRWESVDGVDQWVLIDNTDQLTENGIVFADARWATAGNVDPVYDPIPSITSLLTSNYLDLDAPDPALFPQGTLLFNTRRSGYNVKQYRSNYFSATNFPDETLPTETNAWVSVSGNVGNGSAYQGAVIVGDPATYANGAPNMGRKAQRAMVVASMISAVNTNQQIREEDTFFNLITAPNYAELQPAMITLNNDRNETAYIIGDTPMRLADNANDIVNWAINAENATSTGEDGLVTRNTFMGLYYPSGITTDLSGSEVVIPPSHMILRTMIYNDTVAYPWFAPAGQRRGTIDNASNIGYIDSASGEFVVTKNRVQLRDVEYSNFINPIAYFTNIGLLNYGNKNSFDSQSALDRTNVARLICYLRYNLQIALRPFIFEPNDDITRNQARGVVQTLLADIQSKRGVYDYIVVCDESNNTPARIDRNELWVDVAIEPTKAAEFIYVPVRILNTGEIAGLGQNG
jgi:hypothetical protein